MGSVSGLSRDQRIRCRERVVGAAQVALATRDSIHHSMGPKRWDGIDHHRDAAMGEFPHTADCSSFVTWCLWNGLALRYGLGDIVNGRDWNFGFTGTMLEHGKRVRDSSSALRGDVVFYGNAPPAQHCAVVTGKRDGEPLVVSQGSEQGPFLLRFDYRSDVMEIRRYI